MGLLLAAGAVAVLVVVAGAALALLRTTASQRPATADLVGSLATVTSEIPAGGNGEVAITQPGQRLRLAAHAEGCIATGATVVVLDVAAPDLVVVAESGF